MVQVLPSPTNLGSQIGQALGMGFQQAAVPAIQQQYQRGQLQRALSGLRESSNNPNATPSDLLFNLIEASSYSPEIGRSLGPLYQTVLAEKQKADARNQVGGMGGGIAAQGNPPMQTNLTQQALNQSVLGQVNQPMQGEGQYPQPRFNPVEGPQRQPARFDQTRPIYQPLSEVERQQFIGDYLTKNPARSIQDAEQAADREANRRLEEYKARALSYEQQEAERGAQNQEDTRRKAIVNNALNQKFPDVIQNGQVIEHGVDPLYKDAAQIKAARTGGDKSEAEIAREATELVNNLVNKENIYTRSVVNRPFLGGLRPDALNKFYTDQHNAIQPLLKSKPAGISQMDWLNKVKSVVANANTNPSVMSLTTGQELVPSYSDIGLAEIEKIVNPLTPEIQKKINSLPRYKEKPVEIGKGAFGLGVPSTKNREKAVDQVAKLLLDVGKEDSFNSFLLTRKELYDKGYDDSIFADAYRKAKESGLIFSPYQQEEAAYLQQPYKPGLYEIFFKDRSLSEYLKGQGQ